MNIVFAISTFSALFFSILFAFPRLFLAKVNYKNISHPDDYDFSDTIMYRIITGVIMAIAWVLTFYTVTRLG